MNNNKKLRKSLCQISIQALCAGLLLPGLAVNAEVPQGYYDMADNTNAQALRNSLHQIIDDHQRYPYSSTATDTWDILEQADQDPDNSAHVIDVYLNASYIKHGAGNSDYNREHSWPKSYGFPVDVSSNYPYTDAHHLFIANDSYNTSRNDKPYDNCTSGCTEKPTEYNNARGGGAGESNWTGGSHTDGRWQTWNGRRGDVARALMYMAVRYEGGTHGITGHDEPDLILTDDRSLMDASQTKANISVGYMGLKSVLLQWHKEDPVDAFEQRRNDVIYGYQGNRNPFIDNPDYVTCVFENICSGIGVPDTPAAVVWINEIHYDNSGGDVNEFVELAGSANTDLSGWSLVGYNGNGGGVYKTENLTGTLTNQQGGMGTLSFAISGLQNGSADGLALVNAAGEVIQFLSYEGSLTASSGPASGMTSTDIGVAETSSTPAGYSLQLVGSGQAYGDFSWASASAETAGNVNNSQTFQ
ncbi:endonuclease [Thalassomonas actiniarum]|uniref:Endonuclease n=1 Tax=Thalassomonas actiniarum TaxID=485447 RepID=A0AAE9YNJ1_9GAMM|nr:endonuclease [Thalassomonas actiniarum]WDD96707.1 endonuclease [Thalassomonas actiniarum]